MGIRPANIWSIILAQCFIQYKVNSLKAEVYTTHNFDFVLSTSYPHFIMFYAPWCQHCEKLLPLWDNFAQENKNKRRFKVAKIDCVENTPVCASEDIKAYPTLRLFSNYKKHTYRGYRNIDGFNAFVQEKVKNLQEGQVPIHGKEEKQKPKKTVTISGKKAKAMIVTKENFREVISDGYAFIDFYAPWCPHCIQLEPVWNQVAARYQHDDTIIIGKVDCTAEPDICKEELIRAYPTLNLYKNGIMVGQYNGGRSLSEIKDFIESNVDRSSIQPTSAKIDRTLVPLEELYINDEEFEGMLNIEMTTLVVYFHHPTLEKEIDHERTLDHLEEFYNAAKRINSDTRPNVRAVVIDCEQFQLFCSSKKVSKYPSITIHFPRGREKPLKYEGRILSDYLVQFVKDFVPGFHERDEL